MSAATQAATQLAQYGLTVNDARDWILQRMEQPHLIYHAALDHGLDSAMLAEILAPAIADVDAAAVQFYFTHHGFNGDALAPPGTPVPGPSPEPDALPDLLPGDESLLLDAMSGLVAFNERTGMLSNDAIRAQAEQFTSAEAYDAMFSLLAASAQAEGAFDDALITSFGLPSFAPTGENLESLLYGTVINVYQSIDQTEAFQLENFTAAHAQGLSTLDPGTMDAFYALMADVFEEPAEVPLITDNELAQTLGLTAGLMANAVDSGALSGVDGLGGLIDGSLLMG